LAQARGLEDASLAGCWSVSVCRWSPRMVLRAGWLGGSADEVLRANAMLGPGRLMPRRRPVPGDVSIGRNDGGCGWFAGRSLCGCWGIAAGSPADRGCRRGVLS